MGQSRGLLRIGGIGTFLVVGCGLPSPEQLWTVMEVIRGENRDDARRSGPGSGHVGARRSAEGKGGGVYFGQSSFAKRSRAAPASIGPPWPTQNRFVPASMSGMM